MREHEVNEDGNEGGNDWNPDDAFASLVAETIDGHNGDHLKHAEAIIHDAAPIAAQTIVHIAKFSPVEKVRLDASKYIIERTLGKTGSGDSGTNPLEDLFKEAMAASQVPNN